MKRSSDKVNMVAGIVLAKGNQNYGMTAPQIIEETGLPKATVHRILKEPGFAYAAAPSWPRGYWFNASTAILTPTAYNESKNGGAAVGDTTDRKFEGKVIEVDTVKGIQAVDNTKILQQEVNDALTALKRIYNNVELFKRGEAKLDTELLKAYREDATKAQFVLETYYQFLDKFMLDPDDITWWENI